ncbi:MAG: phosphoribosyltransferase, partial [Solirubrobacterales bacterium]
MSPQTFADRHQAGALLGRRLGSLGVGGSVVMGLPRGGVPVAFEVGAALGADLDVVLVRKLGAPQQPELAVGAVGEGGVIALNAEVRDRLGIGEQRLELIVERERAA